MELTWKKNREKKSKRGDTDDNDRRGLLEGEDSV